ncbi:hypothetical protein Tco_1076641 [Tanacetum coccineum]
MVGTAVGTVSTAVRGLEKEEESSSRGLNEKELNLYRMRAVQVNGGGGVSCRGVMVQRVVSGGVVVG